MAIDLNFDGVGDGFVMVPEGEHTFVISDAAVQRAKAGDSDVLKLKCEVVGGEADGQSLLQFFSFKQDALWNFRNFLEQVTQSVVEEIQIDEADLVGQQFIGFVEHTQDGKYANLSAFERFATT